MNRFLKGLKAALGWFIVGLIILIAGIVCFFIFYNKEETVIAVVFGFVALIGFIFTFIVPVMVARDKMRSICSSCQTSMARCGAEYSWQCTEAADKYDNQGKFQGVEAIYTCSITCPHCNAENVFDKKLIAKNMSKCNIGIDKYMKSLVDKKN